MSGYIEKRFYRDSVHKKVSGVCAGIARYYGWQRCWVRIATIIIFLCFPVLVGVAYVMASLLLSERSH